MAASQIGCDFLRVNSHEHKFLSQESYLKISKNDSASSYLGMHYIFLTMSTFYKKLQVYIARAKAPNGS